MSASLEELQEQIDQELLNLTPRQRKFAIAYSNGGTTQEQAAISAGYAPANANRNACKIRKSAGKAITLLQRKHSLEQGESISTHRQALLSLFNLCATPDAPTWEPRTAHSVRRTLLELDGFIKGATNGGVNINIELVDPVAGITIDSDTYEDAETEVQSLPSPHSDAEQ